MPILLPQANLKAKDLPSDLFPHKEIIKAYTDAGHDFNFDSDASIQDRQWRHFYALTNANVRLQQQQIE